MEMIDKNINEELNRELEHPAYEMSTIQPKRSKLPFKVWLDDMGEKRDIQHNPFRLKYGPSFNEYVEIPFYKKKKIYSYLGNLSNKKIDMKPISKWINLNYDNLIKFYKQEEDYDFVDFMFDMIPIE